MDEVVLSQLEVLDRRQQHYAAVVDEQRELLLDVRKTLRRLPRCSACGASGSSSEERMALAQLEQRIAAMLDSDGTVAPDHGDVDLPQAVRNGSPPPSSAIVSAGQSVKMPPQAPSRPLEGRDGDATPLPLQPLLLHRGELLSERQAPFDVATTGATSRALLLVAQDASQRLVAAIEKFLSLWFEYLRGRAARLLSAPTVAFRAFELNPEEETLADFLAAFRDVEPHLMALLTPCTASARLPCGPADAAFPGTPSGSGAPSPPSLRDVQTTAVEANPFADRVAMEQLFTQTIVEAVAPVIAACKLDEQRRQQEAQRAAAVASEYRAPPAPPTTLSMDAIIAEVVRRMGAAFPPLQPPSQSGQGGDDDRGDNRAELSARGSKPPPSVDAGAHRRHDESQQVVQRGPYHANSFTMPTTVSRSTTATATESLASSATMTSSIARPQEHVLTETNTNEVFVQPPSQRWNDSSQVHSSVFGVGGHIDEDGLRRLTQILSRLDAVDAPSQEVDRDGAGDRGLGAPASSTRPASTQTSHTDSACARSGVTGVPCRGDAMWPSAEAALPTSPPLVATPQRNGASQNYCHRVSEGEHDDDREPGEPGRSSPPRSTAAAYPNTTSPTKPPGLDESATSDGVRRSPSPVPAFEPLPQLGRLSLPPPQPPQQRKSLASSMASLSSIQSSAFKPMYCHDDGAAARPEPPGHSGAPPMRDTVASTRSTSHGMALLRRESGSTSGGSRGELENVSPHASRPQPGTSQQRPFYRSQSLGSGTSASRNSKDDPRARVAALQESLTSLEMQHWTLLRNAKESGSEAKFYALSKRMQRVRAALQSEQRLVEEIDRIEEEREALRQQRHHREAARQLEKQRERATRRR